MSLSQRNSPEAKWLHGWLVQWLSIPFWAPGLCLSALPHFSYMSLLRHNQASLPSKATFNAKIPHHPQDSKPFPKIMCQVSPLYLCLELGPKNYPIAGIEKGIIITGMIYKSISGFIRRNGYPNSASKQKEQVARMVIQQCLPQTHVNMFFSHFRNRME